MGTVSAAKKFADFEADWDKKAVQSAIEAARGVIGDGLNGRAMISSLSDVEWNWICCAAIFAWIGTKAKQAVEEGTSYDIPIRTMSRDPGPWEAGAIETILPQLGNLENVDGSKPVGEWAKSQIVSFAWQIHKLVDAVLAARDEGSTDKIVTRLDRAEREINAANGGSLMTHKELNDDVPF
jgi:hypothetical protein